MSLLFSNIFHKLLQLAETCQIAADRIRWLQDHADSENIGPSPFTSIDPAPPMPLEHKMSVEELTAQLMDENLSLFTRYRAMFTLRNMQNEQGIHALTQGEHPMQVS